jgi:hypothetical protein
LTRAGCSRARIRLGNPKCILFERRVLADQQEKSEHRYFILLIVGTGVPGNA